MILQIDDTADEIYFPDPHYGDEDGCFAIGGDLSIDRLLLAYSNGIFPWYSFRDQPEILWFCPMKRFVIFPDEIHISHSMRTLMRKNRYSVGINEDFDGVIRGCSKTNGRYWEDGAWLGEKEMIFIVAKKEQKNDIMKAVMKQAGLDTKAKSIVFSLPVTDTAGLRLLED